MAEIRKFDTGATRDTDTGKIDYEGFSHPTVELRYGQYMNKHRVQRDGELRDSDNWTRGIPVKEYMKSLYRHFMDVWMWHRTGKTISGKNIEEALCAVRFNTQGMLYEILRKKE